MSRKPKVFNTLKLDEPSRGRFNINCDDVIEDPLERYPGFFDHPEKCEPFIFANGCDEYSAEDGFPAVLDLSAYYIQPAAREAHPGKSIFLTEYERLNGDVKDEFISEPTAEPETYDQIEAENWQRIKAMNSDELEQARQEIYERLDPKTIEFLKARGQQKEKKPVKVSLFKQQRAGCKPALPKRETMEDKSVKNLEIISDNVGSSIDDIQRLAIDPMHMDFATKYMKSVLPRQEEKMVLLFEKLKIAVTEDGKREKRFGNGVNPIVDGAWCLIPIRRVFDAFEVRGAIVPDDIEIVSLSLLFTVLLLEEQPILFDALFSPDQVYCHLAEVYLLGVDVFRDQVVVECTERLLSKYVYRKAEQGLLSLKLSKGISGLDAFLPFYEDLLKRYLEFSVGDKNFSQILLIPAYMNGSLNDALMIRLLLWTNAEEVIRQVTITKDSASRLLNYVSKKVVETSKLWSTSATEQFNLLLTSYKVALEKKLVLPSRNEAMYLIARQQLGCWNDA